MGKLEIVLCSVLIFTVVFSLCWLKTESNNLYQRAFVQIPNFFPEIPKPQDNERVNENVSVYMFMNACLTFDLTYAETTFEIINEGSEHFWISFTFDVPESLNLTVELWEKEKFISIYTPFNRAHLLPFYSWNAIVTIQNFSDCNAQITFISTPYDGRIR